MMSILYMLIVGLVAGGLARYIFPGEQKMGWIATILLGIGGSLLAGFLGRAIGWYREGETAQFIASTVGALILLFVWNRLSQNKKPGGSV